LCAFSSAQIAITAWIIYACSQNKKYTWIS
jgi:hypothetical protein